MNHQNLLMVFITILLAIATTPAGAASWCTAKGCFCEGAAACTILFASAQCKPRTTHWLPLRSCDGPPGPPSPQGWCQVSDAVALSIQAKTIELGQLVRRPFH